MIAILRQILIKPTPGIRPGRSTNRMPSRRTRALAASFILVGTAAGLALGRASDARTTLPPWAAVASNSQESTKSDLNSDPSFIITSKQKRAILKSNFEGIKKNTEELATLAKSLQEEVDKSNENVLSLKIVEKAEKIENLAKKIKNSAKGE